MKQFLNKKQKIIATCILKKENKIFLLRGSKFYTNLAIATDTGYFDVPKFEIGFGEDPEFLIKEKFIKYFGHSVTIICVVDVKQDIIGENTTQIFEIVYTIKCEDFPACSQKQGVFFFAGVSELSSYMLSKQRENIIKYL